jgi:hypothetical protein
MEICLHACPAFLPACTQKAHFTAEMNQNPLEGRVWYQQQH